MSKLLGVEAARGIAALLVVLVHATNMLSDKKYLGEQALGGLFKFGHAGVDFFFVLSGFIIYYIHSDEIGSRSHFSGYWIKRLVRIFPAYWIVLAGYGLILTVSPTREMYERDLLVIFHSVFLIPNVHGPILGVAWTLSHELLFYMLFSVLFFNLRLAQTLFAIWAVLILYNVIYAGFQGMFWNGFLFRIFNMGFFFGILVAYCVKHWPMRSPAVFFWIGTAMFFLAGFYESWGANVPTEWPPLHFAYAIGAALALYGLVGLERAKRIRLPKIMVTLGEASYSIYLLHVIIIMILQQVLLVIKRHVPLPTTLTFAVVVVVAVSVAVLFSKMIEQPLLRRLRPSRLSSAAPLRQVS